MINIEKSCLLNMDKELVLKKTIVYRVDDQES
jgi:hypothetical protein